MMETQQSKIPAMAFPLAKSQDPITDRTPSRALRSACIAHAVHDGLTDLTYVLLPIWQTQFAISYAMAGLMRGLYSGVMAVLQIKASGLSKRFGRRALLVTGTALAGLGYLLAGQAGGIVGVCAALAFSGMGASTQHPLASSLVADTHQGATSKQALASYNFSGDIGKMLVPALVGASLGWIGWRQSVTVIGVLGIATAVILARTIPALPSKIPPDKSHGSALAHGRTISSGFIALLMTGVLDSAGRMGFLTFLPFILKSKGAASATIGLALSLLFIGGAAGKLVCGYLGVRLGMMRTVWLTEAATALFILLIPGLGLSPALALLPLLGLALNGTSSVLYGTVPDLVKSDNREHPFALFYTGTIGGGALSPLLFGYVSDHAGIPFAMRAIAGMLLLTLPLAWWVQRKVEADAIP
jgi:predicted MFS family arabinose efflux permease